MSQPVAARIPRPPDHMVRWPMHVKAKKYLISVFASSAALGVCLYFMYVEPRRKAFVKYGNSYDAYERMREICSYPKKYMHSCPSELAKRFEEKGLVVAEDPEFTFPMDPEGAKPKKEHIYSSAIERFVLRP